MASSTTFGEDSVLAVALTSIHCWRDSALVYLIPINFRLPLIFGWGWPKIKGTEKVQLFGWPKIKGTEINSKPFENASSRLDSNFRNIETQKL